MGESFDNEQNIGYVYEDVEVTGEVIEQYRTIWGVHKFLVALEDGSLKTICADECRVIRENGNLEVKVMKLRDEAVIPFYAHSTDAGMDLVATSKHEDEYGNIVYGIGLAFEIPEGYAGFIFPRSSNHKHSLLLSNCVGIVDAGYRGEVSAKFRKDYQYMQGNGLVHNISTEYEVGERVAQMVILPYPKVSMVEVTELSNSERGANGYGSTGK
jgi:dUTP pyrophosphatase